MIQIKIGIGSVTFSNMGPMRGQYVFLTTKIIYIFFLHSILLFWAMYMEHHSIEISVLIG